jgi:CDP-2,3-bis-(O-geranylgeranyl)-sn-glycerol synthase
MVNMLWFLDALYHYLPAYFANATPVIINGGGPVDFGAKWLDGKPFLGDHKTIVGTASGILAGIIIGALQQRVLNGVLLSVGAIVGDMFTSFIKRRLELVPGSSMPVGDQLGFIIMAIFLGYMTPPDPTIEQSLFVLVATLPIHYLVNVIAYLGKMKNTPW